MISSRPSQKCGTECAEHREPGRAVVAGFAAPDGGDHPRGNADQDGQEQAQRRELERQRDAAARSCRDREPAVRSAEVPLQRLREPLDVLHGQRSVEPVEVPVVRDERRVVAAHAPSPGRRAPRGLPAKTITLATKTTRSAAPVFRSRNPAIPTTVRRSRARRQARGGGGGAAPSLCWRRANMPLCGLANPHRERTKLRAAVVSGADGPSVESWTLRAGRPSLRCPRCRRVLRADARTRAGFATAATAARR